MKVPISGTFFYYLRLYILTSSLQLFGAIIIPAIAIMALSNAIIPLLFFSQNTPQPCLSSCIHRIGNDRFFCR